MYLRCLNTLDLRGQGVISSQDLARLLDLHSAQVRKDLAYFGEFGKRGVGYPIPTLRAHIVDILGLQSHRHVGIVGAGGRLGRALALYKGFETRGFKIVGLFDNDPHVIQQEFGNGEVVAHVSELPRIVKERQIEILILTVPSEAITEVFDYVILSGIKAILNFAPVKLRSTDAMDVHNVDLAQELETLSYHLSLRESGVSVLEAE